MRRMTVLTVLLFVLCLQTAALAQYPPSEQTNPDNVVTIYTESEPMVIQESLATTGPDGLLLLVSALSAIAAGVSITWLYKN